jgi:uncharacterized protein YdbL (DUF1318 family)
MRSFAKLWLVIALSAAPAACITVNIYFPAPQVRAAAEEIVEETWGQAHPGGSQPPADSGAAPAPQPESLLDLFGAPSAWAQDHPDVEVSTAAIRALKASMKQRAEELKPFMARGSIGIANDGMLLVRAAGDLTLSEQAKIRRLVEAENRDRKALYAEIAQANGYPEDRVKDIQKIFAEIWINKAEKGWAIQKPDGSWTTR